MLYLQPARFSVKVRVKVKFRIRVKVKFRFRDGNHGRWKIEEVYDFIHPQPDNQGTHSSCSPLPDQSQRQCYSLAGESNSKHSSCSTLFAMRGFGFSGEPKVGGTLAELPTTICVNTKKYAHSRLGT